MMLFKLSLKNIKKSFKDYTIYFFTLILGVSIFYVFNSIDSQTVLLNVTKSTAEIIDLMVNLLSGVSVFVSFILGFLIIYASRFLIKRRNKEFGIYLTLGMSKRKISMILFFETIFIGLISLAIGLGLGAVLSQFMSLLVANMFEADMTKFTFIFSVEACQKTLVYFGIMYFLVMIFNTFNISKCKLIDLLQARKKSETIKLKNPILCVLIFLISAIVLGYAYYMVTGGIKMLDSFDKIFIPIIMGVVSTFFLFWSLSGLLLKLVMSMKNFYYKGLNSFTLRQISSKVNTTVFSMTIICLMLFVTICVLSSSLSIKNSMKANLNELAPADIEFEKPMNLQIKSEELTIDETLKQFDFNLDDYLKEKIEFYFYTIENFTYKQSLGEDKEVKEKYKVGGFDWTERIMKISDYNKVAKFYGNETYTLDDDQYMVVADFDSMVEVRNIVLKRNRKIEVFGHTLTPKYQECKDGFVEMSANHINTGIILVPDEIVDDKYISAQHVIGNYYITDKMEKAKLEEKIDHLSKHEKAAIYNLPAVNTRLAIAESSVGLGALVTFIGLYLGIIFLISSAAILALKELSESTDNKERFMMIRKLGTDEKMIHKALFRQIGIFFLFPLLLAIIHSIFGIQFCNFILETFGDEKLLPSIIMTAFFLCFIYGGYFLITYYCSKNIIK